MCKRIGHVHKHLEHPRRRGPSDVRWPSRRRPIDDRGVLGWSIASLSAPANGPATLDSAGKRKCARTWEAGRWGRLFCPHARPASTRRALNMKLAARRLRRGRKHDVSPDRRQHFTSFVSHPPLRGIRPALARPWLSGSYFAAANGDRLTRHRGNCNQRSEEPTPDTWRKGGRGAKRPSDHSAPSQRWALLCSLTTVGCGWPRRTQRRMSGQPTVKTGRRSAGRVRFSAPIGAGGRRLRQRRLKTLNNDAHWGWRLG